jgi:hypothetical protein
MKINATKLHNFISKVTLNEDIASAILKTSEKGMTVSLISDDNTYMVRGILNKSVFSDYKDSMEITLGATNNKSDVRLLQKILKGFKEFVNIDIVNNALVLQENKRAVNMTLTDKEFVSNKFDKELPFEFSKGFVIKSDFITKILSNITALTNTKEFPIVRITIKDKKLEINVYNTQTSIKEYEDLDFINCSIEVSGNRFNKAFGSIDKEVEISIIDNAKPMLIKEKTDEMIISTILAPRMEGDEEVKKEEKKEVKKE